MQFSEKLKKINTWQWLLIFVGFGLLFYHQALLNFFVSDDFHWLTIARDTKLSWRIFLTNYEGSNIGGSYNPLLVVIFKFFYQLFQLNYFSYHLTSLVLHGINAWLVYRLAAKLLSLTKIGALQNWSLLAGFLFLIWPVQVEVISWIAAWPHLWMTSFYLLSLISYFTWRQNHQQRDLFLSFVFFGVALLIKESAISLPPVILLAEIYFYSVNRKEKFSIIYLPGYFGLMLIFMLSRYLATGLLFGYYGQHDLQASFTSIIGNLGVYFGEIVSFGFIRALMYQAVYYFWQSIVILLLAGLAYYFYLLARKKQWWQFMVFCGFMSALIPFLITGMHRLTFAGERYLYLPSIFFVIWLVYLLAILPVKAMAKKTMLICLVLIFGGIIFYKGLIWQAAGNLSRQIVGSYGQLETGKTKSFLSVGLPDNLSGAEVFRNNLGQALQLYYGEDAPEILPTYSYVMLTLKNYNQQLLKWRPDDLGWFAESVDGTFVVTGITSIEVNGVYWELWNYNYQNYSANVIRFMPTAEMKQRIASGEVGILTYDQGKLKIVK